MSTIVPIEVQVHPLVLLSVVDHYKRVADGTKKRVVGVLLGTWKGKIVDISNSFAVPFDEDEKNSSIWFLDHNYLERMWSMFRKVNAKEQVIGWYHTGPKLRPNDLEINEVIRRFTNNPVLAVIDVLTKNVGLPIDAYMATEQLSEDGSKSSKLFQHVPSIMTAEEAEDVGVEHLLRDVRDIAIGTLSTRVTEIYSSMRGLSDRVRGIQTYLEAVGERKFPVNQEIIDDLQRVTGLLPDMCGRERNEPVYVKLNDYLMLIYISSIARSLVSLHNLIDNKTVNREIEKQYDNAQLEKIEKATIVSKE